MVIANLLKNRQHAQSQQQHQSQIPPPQQHHLRKQSSTSQAAASLLQTIDNIDDDESGPNLDAIFVQAAAAASSSDDSFSSLERLLRLLPSSTNSDHSGDSNSDEDNTTILASLVCDTSTEVESNDSRNDADKMISLPTNLTNKQQARNNNNGSSSRRVQFAGLGSSGNSTSSSRSQRSSSPEKSRYSKNSGKSSSSSRNGSSSRSGVTLIKDWKTASHDELVDRVESLQEKVIALQLELANERSNRKRKQKSLVKLAHEMGKRAQERQALQKQVNQLSSQLTQTKVQLMESNAERDALLHFSDQQAQTPANLTPIMPLSDFEAEKKEEDLEDLIATEGLQQVTAREVDEPMEGGEDQNSSTATNTTISESSADNNTSASSVTWIPVNEKTTATTTPKTTSRGLPPTMFNKEESDPPPPEHEPEHSHRGMGATITCLAFILSAVVMYLTHSELLLSLNGWCGPVMPGQHVFHNSTFGDHDENPSMVVHWEAPWWMGRREWKKPAFVAICGTERPRVLLQWDRQGRILLTNDTCGVVEALEEHPAARARLQSRGHHLHRSRHHQELPAGVLFVSGSDHDRQLQHSHDKEQYPIQFVNTSAHTLYLYGGASGHELVQEVPAPWAL